MRNILWLTLFVSGALALGGIGCQVAHAPVSHGLGNPFNPPVGDIQSGLTKFILFGVLAVALGIALYFFSPAAHTVSFTLAGFGASLEIASLILKVSLGFLPWLIGGLVIGAILFLYYEYVTNKAAVTAVIAKVV